MIHMLMTRTHVSSDVIEHCVALSPRWALPVVVVILDSFEDAG